MAEEADVGVRGMTGQFSHAPWQTTDASPTEVALRAFGREPRRTRARYDARLLPKYRHQHEAVGLAVALVVVLATVAAAALLSWVAALAIVGVLILTAMVTRLAVAENLARAAEITRTQFAHLYPMLAELHERFELPRTRVFVVQSPVINAVSSGFHEPYAIVLNSALIDALDEQELKSVLGHEMGHIKLGHTRLGVLLGGLDARGVLLPFPLNLVASTRDLVFRWWQRSTEMSADRAGLIACGRPSKAISAQIKLSVGPNLYQHVNLDDLAHQAADLNFGVRRLEGFLSQVGSSHPFLVNRIEAMLDFVSQLDVADESEEPPRAVDGACLVARGPHQQWQHAVTGPTLLVGRSPSTDLRLRDRAVSRRHFELRWEHDAYVLRDLHSSNGTFVNGRRVSSVRLEDGDIIRCGVTELEFRTGPLPAIR